MTIEVLLIGLIVGVGTWAMRFLPTRLNVSSVDPDGPVSRFLNATGPAAITALTVAAFLPLLQADLRAMTLLSAGVAGTIAGFFVRRDISVATVAGAVAYGLAFWLL